MNRTVSSNSLVVILPALLVFGMAAACAAQPSMQRAGDSSLAVASRAAPADSPITAASVNPPTSQPVAAAVSAPALASAVPAVASPAYADGVNPEEGARMEALWQARTSNRSNADFTLGPGDVIDVSVPAIDELKERSVRVSGDDSISLPLVGTINVSGMTEEDIRNELKRRLQKYMYDPQVDVFVKDYESRQVAVVGMVQKPGLYTLSSSSDTILAMISKAGGATEAAASRILLVPAPPGQNAKLSAMLGSASATTAAAPPVAAESIASKASGPQKASSGEGGNGGVNMPANYNLGSALPPALSQSEPIVIDLNEINAHTHLDLPVRPGDVIIVPAAGEVMVKGWVQNAGAFRITPGMTALGAIAAAGGQMFSSDAEILRIGHGGGKIEIPLDLAAIEKGTAPDEPVQGGDVLIVHRSITGAVPYGLYTVLSKFGTGLYPAIPFF